ncbi:MAG TPA: glutathione binding-like protein [Polyangiaceae bacterium]|nr:glutathione binding-like protein [Polyangiaceae bacterium]
MKLYGHPISTCTRKVLFTAQEKGHKLELVVVDLAKGEHKSADHLSRQPFGQVPALDDGGFALYESRAIARYLDEVLSGPKLTPSDAKGRALMEQWLSVETSNFTPHAMKIVHQRLFNPMRGQPCDEAVVAEATKPTGRALDVIDRQLGKTRYLAGSQFTLADLTYVPYLEYLVASKAGDLVEARRNVARWWSELSARPAWKAVTGK